MLDVKCTLLTKSGPKAVAHLYVGEEAFAKMSVSLEDLNSDGRVREFSPSWHNLGAVSLGLALKEQAGVLAAALDDAITKQDWSKVSKVSKALCKCKSWGLAGADEVTLG